MLEYLDKHVPETDQEWSVYDRQVDQVFVAHARVVTGKTAQALCTWLPVPHIGAALLHARACARTP